MLCKLNTNKAIAGLVRRLSHLDSHNIEPSEVGMCLAPYGHIPAFLRALLVTDGTVTMALEAFFLEAICINTLRQGYLELPLDLPALGLAEGETCLYREVELIGANTGNMYVHASSVINKKVIKMPIFERLVNEHEGIGVVLRNVAKGSFREVLQLGAGGLMINAAMHRTYRVSLNATPAILITEEFPLAAFI